MIKIRIGYILQLLKKYSINILLVASVSYLAPCVYNVFHEYEKHTFSQQLIQHITQNEELPVAKSEEHKFINALTQCSNTLSGFNEWDSYVINNVNSYVHPFDNVSKFNILKELVLQKLLLNMSSGKRNTFLMEKRLMNIHGMFRNFHIENSERTIRIVNPTDNFQSLLMSFIADANSPEVLENFETLESFEL